jgi:hypothetical protein
MKQCADEGNAEAQFLYRVLMRGGGCDSIDLISAAHYFKRSNRLGIETELWRVWDRTVGIPRLVCSANLHLLFTFSPYVWAGGEKRSVRIGSTKK